MTIEKQSPCKTNLLLNILGKRHDGFHELETIMQPVRMCDSLRFSLGGSKIEVTCSNPALPTDAGNLVCRAAEMFLKAARIDEGVRIHLEKKIPLAAGLGGGSGNAATTLMALNELFGEPLAPQQLQPLAASLGSDVPFFLQSQPALAIGRGDQITPLKPFPALRNSVLLLIHPGFGIATAWAYQQLAYFPEALNGQRGRAQQLLSVLEQPDLNAVGAHLYNSLEAPALKKFPILRLFQEFLRENGAPATLMSGSGSTTFAILRSRSDAEAITERFRSKFGALNWIAVVPI